MAKDYKLVWLLKLLYVPSPVRGHPAEHRWKPVAVEVAKDSPISLLTKDEAKELAKQLTASNAGI